MTLDEADPRASSGSFTVRAASLTTGNEQRDGHLRSADFFDAETHPEITFVSTAITPRRGNDYAVTGDLTIRGTTRPVTFDVEFLGLYQGFQGRRAGFHATTKLNREDWGLTWNVTLETGGWLVGKEIKLEIDLALDEVGAAPRRRPSSTRRDRRRRSPPPPDPAARNRTPRPHHACGRGVSMPGDRR